MGKQHFLTNPLVLCALAICALYACPPAACYDVSRTRSAALPQDHIKVASVPISYGMRNDGSFAVSVNLPIPLLDEYIKGSVGNLNQYISLLKQYSSRMLVLDPSKAMITTDGHDIFVGNLGVYFHKSKLCDPRFTLTPFMAGPNKVGLKIKHVDFGRMTSMIELAEMYNITSKELVITQVIYDTIFGIQDALGVNINTKNGELEAKNINPNNLVTLSYKPDQHTVYVSLADKFLVPLAPKIKITQLALTKTAITLSAATENTAAAVAKQNFQMAFDEGAVNLILGAVSNKQISFNQAENYPTGIEFSGSGGPGSVTLSAAVRTPFVMPVIKRNVVVAFTGIVTPLISEPDTLSISFDAIKINWLGYDFDNDPILSVPDFIAANPILRTQLAEFVARSLVSNPEVKKFASVSMTDKKTVVLKLKKGAVLPMLSKYISITNMQVEGKAMYVKYSLNLQAH